MKKYTAFTLTEIVVILVIIAITALIVIPNLIEENKKLDTISKWKSTYKNIEYVFSAMLVQTSHSSNYEFVNENTNLQREKFIFDMLTPYLRLEKEFSVNEYKTYFLDNSPVKKDDSYYITNLRTTNSGQIVGLKCLNLNPKYADKFPIAILSIDLNGFNKPNKWGYDIFGINIYNNRIEPVGKTDDDYILQSDCSKKGKGLSCSYYYYIYGGQLK